MNLYNIEEQTTFCESLIKDIPELIKYDINNHVHDYCRIYDGMQKSNGTREMCVGFCTKSNVTYPISYQHIFHIKNRPIDKWSEFLATYTTLSDMSYDKPKKLQPIVHQWVKEYEKRLLRKYKINKILTIGFNRPQ